MSNESKKSTKGHLAVAIGSGVSITAWARANGVPRATAFRWAKERAVRKGIESFRRRTVEQALGRLHKKMTGAVDTITKLSREGDCEAIRLKASRAVIAEIIAVSKYSVLEERMTELETSRDEQEAAARGNVWNPGPTNLGYGTKSPPNP
jgi:hypothetical protein